MENEVKEGENKANEFEFEKVKGFGAANFVWHNTKVLAEESSFSVEHTRKILFFKGKPNRATVNYSDFDRIEIKTHFAASDLISGIIIGIISIVTGQLWGLLVVALLVIFSYGKNIVIVRKDGSNVTIQCGGPLSGGWKDEFKRMVPVLSSRAGKQVYSAPI